MSNDFDFHCHSNYSDGALTPESLIDYAVERNLKHLALTDHDSVSGIVDAQKYIQSKQLPIELVSGVEISVMTQFGEIHLVGLAIDHHHQPLNDALTIQQEERKIRAQAICDKLKKLGVDGVFEKSQEMSRQVITRSHIAKSLLELGYVKDMQQAFKKYLGKNGKVKAAKNWMPLEKGIQLIHAAGGKAVLAHPTRYPITNRKLALLIAEFAETKGDAIEMAYPSLNADKINWLKIHREENDLLASSGSDFHYPGLKWTDLGRFPKIHESIPHVKDEVISG